MTTQRYYDVIHFLTDSDENCTGYVKLNSKMFLFVELFDFWNINGENYDLLRKSRAYCTVTLHLSPIPFGPLIKVGSVMDTSFTYLRILFQHKKNKIK